MSDANLRQIRVLHIVSSGGADGALQQSLLMPLLTRLPKPRVKSQVACLSPGAVPSAVLRNSGVPVYDFALSRQRFSPRAFKELVQTARQFRPDVIQAWGYTAQIVSNGVRKRCDWKPRLVWSVSNTVPLAKDAGFIDRKKVAYAAKHSQRADRIVYTSEAGASTHRRLGFPESGHAVIPAGVDATRFKPDFAARRKLREELGLGGDSFVIGMSAPFQPEYDHTTLLKAVGELIKVNPDVAVVLAGHGVQKGNAPLMALVGGGTLAQRVHLLGEWSDVASLFNGCDVVCSSAINDNSRMTLVMAMLCGVPCVGTGIGAQGETIGQFGVAVEPGNPAAFVKGITRVMQMPADKRTHMAQNARKHALDNFVYVRSLQKYLQLYYDLIGRQSLVTQDLPTPDIDAAVAAPPPLPTAAELAAAKSKKKSALSVSDLSDPDSLEAKVAERSPEALPQWRREQEEARAKREAELEQQVAATKTVGDVLQVFEAQLAKPSSSPSSSPMTERARGVTEEMEDLLAPELLSVPAPARTGNQPVAGKPSAPTAASASSTRSKSTASTASSGPMTRPVATSTSPMTRPAVTPAAPITRPPATPVTGVSAPAVPPAPPVIAPPATAIVPPAAAPAVAASAPAQSAVEVVPPATTAATSVVPVDATPASASQAPQTPAAATPAVTTSVPAQSAVEVVPPAATVATSVASPAATPAVTSRASTTAAAPPVITSAAALQALAIIRPAIASRALRTPRIATPAITTKAPEAVTTATLAGPAVAAAVTKPEVPGPVASLPAAMPSADTAAVAPKVTAPVTASDVAAPVTPNATSSIVEAAAAPTPPAPVVASTARDSSASDNAPTVSIGALPPVASEAPSPSPSAAPTQTSASATVTAPLPVWPFSATANQTPAAALGTSLPAASGGVADAPLDGLQTLSLFATEQAAATPARVSQREEDGTLRLELLPIEELRRANGC